MRISSFKAVSFFRVTRCSFSHLDFGIISCVCMCVFGGATLIIYDETRLPFISCREDAKRIYGKYKTLPTSSSSVKKLFLSSMGGRSTAIKSSWKYLHFFNDRLFRRNLLYPFTIEICISDNNKTTLNNVILFHLTRHYACLPSVAALLKPFARRSKSVHIRRNFKSRPSLALTDQNRHRSHSNPPTSHQNDDQVEQNQYLPRTDNL